MLAIVPSATLIGLEGRLIRVEVDVAPGLPGFTIVGLADTALQEARERVRGALRNTGFVHPPRRITVNLAPAACRLRGIILAMEPRTEDTAMEAPTRVALYARLSRDRTGEETATARQIEDCRALVAARGWTVVGEFTDADVSAFKRNTPRPGYDAMLAELDAGRVDAIVAWKLDRLLRRSMDWEKLWERCEPHGTRIVTVRDGIDTSLPMVGEILPRLMTVFAQLESTNLSVRELRKHEETARKGGRSGGGKRPFGLTEDWSAIVEPEAALIRAAVTRILNGESMYRIAAEWNAAGIRTPAGQKAPTGHTWTTQHVSSMLAAPRLAGLRVHHGEIVAKGTWPAIIDQAAHERLKAMLSGHHRPGRPGVYLLSGLVVCGICGHRMVIRRRHKDQTRFYGCQKAENTTACGGRHIVAEPLEALITDMALTAVDAPALHDELRRRAVMDDPDAELAAALAVDEAALEQLARDHYVDRLIGRAEFLAARDELHGRVEAARTRLSRPAAPSMLRELAEGGVSVRDAWEAGDVEWRRQLLGTLIDRVAIGPGAAGASRFDPARVEVVWRA